MPDRLQYHFAEDVYGVQRGLDVDPRHTTSLPTTAGAFEPEPAQRKRGKFTRSKTGCLTCRTKKVKCDEEKPDCKRCRDTQRRCTWPEIVPTRKRPARRDTRQSESPMEIRPSTAGSSGLSDVSTPPPRTHSPPKQPLLPTHIHPSSIAQPHPPALQLPPYVQRHLSTPNISTSAQRQQMMMGTNSLSYALNPHPQTNHSQMSPSTSLPNVSHIHPASSSYPYRYPTQPQSQYVQQQQYSAFQGLSRVTTQPHDYTSVKLEDSYDPPIKYEEQADDWQMSHYPQHQHVEPIQPFITALHERDLVGSAQYPVHYRYQ